MAKRSTMDHLDRICRGDMNTFEFSVSLRIFSIDVAPAEICAQLGLKPKWTHKIGEPRTNPVGVVLGGVYDESYCSFPIERKYDEDLADLLARVTKDLAKHADLFLKICAGGGRSEFFIGWYSVGNTGSTFGNSLLKQIGELGIDLALDVYGEAATNGPISN